MCPDIGCAHASRSLTVSYLQRHEISHHAHAHREAWLTGYRGVLGFATLVLVDNPAAP